MCDPRFFGNSASGGQPNQLRGQGFGGLLRGVVQGIAQRQSQGAPQAPPSPQGGNSLRPLFDFATSRIPSGGGGTVANAVTSVLPTAQPSGALTAGGPSALTSGLAGLAQGITGQKSGSGLLFNQGKGKRSSGTTIV